jgi:hypothetical protein
LINDIKSSEDHRCTIPDDKDIYYGGDTAKWIKLAYSLKARYLLAY